MPRKFTSPSSRPSPSRSWDPVAAWYAGWAGRDGSHHHRYTVIPLVLRLLEVEAGERVLDLGCGPGVLAPHIARAGAAYTGIDSSHRLVTQARRDHGRSGSFLVGDATRLHRSRTVPAAAFDAVLLALSIQDIAPLDDLTRGVGHVLRTTGRVVIVMTHPCFRVPRQSGWGWDPDRRQHFRRVDRYLSELDVPMKRYGPSRSQATRSYHRPLQTYVRHLSAQGLWIDAIEEVPSHDVPRTRLAREVGLAASEIPLFMGIRARRREWPRTSFIDG